MANRGDAYRVAYDLIEQDIRRALEGKDATSRRVSSPSGKRKLSHMVNGRIDLENLI